MKNKKVVLWIALIVTAIIPVYAQQYDSEKDFQIDWGNNGGVKIAKYIGAKKEVRIPPSIQNNPVTEIGKGAFGESGITSVIIPNSVTIIGDSAFIRCNSLTSVTIPNSVTSIGYFAFYGCSSLRNITLPDSITSIEGGAFYKCTSIASVTIPKNVTIINIGTFNYCTSLTSVIIPNSVIEIGGNFDLLNSPYGEIYGVFSGCSKLTNITIPDSVTYINPSAFVDCTKLTSIIIPDRVTRIGKKAFSRCTGLTSVTIPKNVTYIGERAFEDCTGLTSVTFQCTISSDNFDYWYTFPGDLREKYLANDGGAGVYARFAGGEVWRKTQSLVSPPKPSASVPTTTATTAEPTPGLEYTLIDSRGSGLIYGTYAVSRGKVFSMSAIVIPSTYNDVQVTRIKQQGFQGARITGITIPNSVTSIGDYAFENCTYLTKITLPASITHINYSAFKGCTSLTSVTFQGNITSSNFSSSSPFPGDLRAKYLAGGPGTYTTTNGSTWTKQ
jgi:hypothetical protein